MQIHRFHIGLVTNAIGKIIWFSRPEYVKSLCDCHIWSIGPVCVTWLSDECLQPDSKD